MVSLRKIQDSDKENMLDILTSDRVNQTYMLPDFEKREDAIPLFERLKNMSQDKKVYVRAIDLDGALIGFINQVEITEESMELGYVVHPEYHGKGYMTKALPIAIAQVHEAGYREVITGAFSQNTASLRVMEKCAMEKMEKSDQIEYRGKTHTCLYYHHIQE